MIEKIIDGAEPWLLVIVACCVFLLGLKVGYVIGDAKVARLEATQATAQRDTAVAVTENMIAAQRLANALESKLAASEQTRLSQQLEHQREIKRLTTGRPCLNGGTVRLLNSSAGIQPAAVPESASEPPAEDAAAASDTDIAGWIDHAIRQYETCRGRLGALIDFEKGEVP